MRVGTIGSGVIVDRMIDAMKMTSGIEVCAVYSRTRQKACDFAKKHQISKYYDDLSEMFKDPDLDTIYVASPNGLHYQQSKEALKAGKHVICEKPFVPTLSQANDLFQLANQNQVFIFEAITTIHLPNYHIVKKHLPDVGDIKMVQCNFSQYSSRYGKYKDQIVTNVFDPQYSGGALMDINVYCLHFVTGLFGYPLSSRYFCNKGFNGIDTSGVVLMQYPGMLASCTGAKDSSSPNFVYIQGDTGTLLVHGSSCGVCAQVDFLPVKGDMIGKKDQTSSVSLGIEQKSHMIYECEVFQSIVKNHDIQRYDQLCDHTRKVVSLLEISAQQRDEK